MISVQEFLTIEVVAAALLALWLVTRFPGLNPQSIRSALGRCIAALAIVQLISVGTELALRLPYGAYAALFGCALPAFFVAFLAAAWLMGLLAGAAGGSGGGPGHHVPASSR